VREMKRIYEGKLGEKFDKALNDAFIEATERCEAIAERLGLKFKGFAEDTNMIHVSPFYSLEVYDAIFEDGSGERKAMAIEVRYVPSLQVTKEPEFVTIYVASAKDLIHELKDP
jgi:hypothetical protein